MSPHQFSVSKMKNIAFVPAYEVRSHHVSSMFYILPFAIFNRSSKIPHYFIHDSRESKSINKTRD